MSKSLKVEGAGSLESEMHGSWHKLSCRPSDRFSRPSIRTHPVLNLGGHGVNSIRAYPFLLTTTRSPQFPSSGSRNQQIAFAAVQSSLAVRRHRPRIEHS